MKLKQTGPLAPITEPWTLIRDAISDLELQEDTEGVRVYMLDWHTGFENECLQCLAGCAMSRRLNCDTQDNHTPSCFNDKDAARLNALDFFRRGHVEVACLHLGMTFPSDLPGNFPIPLYEVNPKAFKRSMLALSDRLEDKCTPVD